MRDPAQLAKCLRCISSTGETAQPCPYAECVYDCAEPVTEKTKEFEALAEDDGCFHSIDCDRIGLDAAELIEKLRRENRQFRAAFDKAATESAYFKAAFVKACEANDDLFKKLIKMKAERDAAVKASGNGEEYRMAEFSETIVWHEVNIRRITEEEIKEVIESEYYDYIPDWIFDCKMPDDGEEILIATRWGVDKDVNGIDEGYYLEGGEWDDVKAWARMPKYKKVESNDKY